MIRGEVALWRTLVALTATPTNWTRGIAHAEHQGLLATWQWAYVIVVISLVPVLAAILHRTGVRRAGAWLLLSSILWTDASEPSASR
jgi:hypothetical protein